MRISFYEPILSDYHITTFENNLTFEIGAPLRTYKTETMNELKLVYTWGFLSDRTDIDGIWEIGSDLIDTTYTHKIFQPVTEDFIKAQAEKDIKDIKSNWINKPYNCKNCQHCLSYKKDQTSKKDGYWCYCSKSTYIRDDGKKYSFQSCSDYEPIDKEK